MIKKINDLQQKSSSAFETFCLLVFRGWSDLTSHYQIIRMSQTRVHVTWTMSISERVTENI